MIFPCVKYITFTGHLQDIYRTFKGHLQDIYKLTERPVVLLNAILLYCIVLYSITQSLKQHHLCFKNIPSWGQCSVKKTGHINLETGRRGMEKQDV